MFSVLAANLQTKQILILFSLMSKGILYIIIIPQASVLIYVSCSPYVWQ